MEIDLESWDQLPAQGNCFKDNKTFTLLFSGGLGSGKTHYLCRKVLKLSALNRDYPGGFLVPTFPDFRKDVKPEFEKIFSELNMVKGRHWDFHETFKEYTFCWTSAPLYIFTGEKPIAGPNLSYCAINEYSLIKWVRVNEMIRRVRLKNAPYLQRCLAGTPEDVHGWLEEFIEGQEKLDEKKPHSFRIVTADTNENIHIDDSYREALEATMDKVALSIFAEGKIGIRAGNDYFYYSYDDNLNVTEEAEYRDQAIVWVGLDFNVGKMAASFSHYLKGDKPGGEADELHIFNEMYLKGDSNTYTMCRELILMWCSNETVKQKLQPYRNDQLAFDKIWFSYPEPMRKQFLSQLLVICDASGKNRTAAATESLFSNIKILKYYNFNVKHKAANPRLRNRQLLVNGLLDNKRLKVHPRCKLVRKDFKNVRQKDGTFLKDEGTNKEFTHFSDGVDYVVDWNFKLPSRNNNKVSSQPR